LPKRATRLPDDWKPGPLTDRAKRNADVLGKERYRAEVEKFRCYFQAAAGRQAMAVDWQKRFYVWLENAVAWYRKNSRPEEPKRPFV
jgi:hypothetical protein